LDNSTNINQFRVVSRRRDAAQAPQAKMWFHIMIILN